MADKKEEVDLILTHMDEDCEKYFGAVVPPVFFDSLYTFPNMDEFLHMNVSERYTFAYGRSDNPVTRIIETKLSALEKGTYSLFFSAGMAATNAAITATCKAGSHIICMRNAYGPVREYLENIVIPNMNASVTFVKGTDVEEIEAAIRPETSLIMLESPSSHAFSLCDLRGIAALARKSHIWTYIDNTYCTPIFQNPLELGIDIVMHTATKYLGGHSDLTGGALVVNDKEIYEKMKKIRDWQGSIIGPMESWLVMRGMRTLRIRMEQYCRTGLEVAEFLEKHPKIKEVRYPGLPSHPQYELMKAQQRGNGSLMSFSIDGTKEQAAKLVDHLRLFKIGYSWGGYESLAETPFYNSSRKELKTTGLPDNLIRIYCGLEGSGNLCADLSDALDAI